MRVAMFAIIALAGCKIGAVPIDGLACPCAEDWACDIDVCVEDCGAKTECDGVCADLSTDPNHCGRCRVACGLSESCVAGICRALDGGGRSDAFVDASEDAPRDVLLDVPFDTPDAFDAFDAFAFTVVTVEAESGTFEPPWEATTDGVRILPGTPVNDDGDAPSNGSTVGQLMLPIGGFPEGAEVRYWLRYRAPGAGNDNIWISLDGGVFREDRFTTTGTDFQWEEVTRGATATGGTAPIVFKNREAGFELDRVIATDDPDFVP